VRRRLENNGKAEYTFIGQSYVQGVIQGECKVEAVEAKVSMIRSNITELLNNKGEMIERVFYRPPGGVTIGRRRIENNQIIQGWDPLRKYLLEGQEVKLSRKTCLNLFYLTRD
jgi:hypothetical protein